MRGELTFVRQRLRFTMREPRVQSGHDWMSRNAVKRFE